MSDKQEPGIEQLLDEVDVDEEEIIAELEEDTEGEPEVEHLYCTECNDRVGVARFDGTAKLVCHCTHVDGEIDPILLTDLGFNCPLRWEWNREVL